jgi:hypothetical protein
MIFFLFASVVPLYGTQYAQDAQAKEKVPLFFQEEKLPGATNRAG